MIPSNLGQGPDERKFGHVVGHGHATFVPLVVLLLGLVLMTMPFQYGLFYQTLLVVGQHVCVHHVIEHQLRDIIQVVGRHVQADGAVQKHATKLK